MAQFSLLTELDRKVILFNYEQSAATNDETLLSVLDEDARSYIVRKGEYILWELEKRKLTESEVLSHSWLITSEYNTSLLLNFQNNNYLTISNLFSNDTYRGHWLIENGILMIYFRYENHNYDINIIASNNRPIHSAIQVIDNDSINVLKAVPLRNAKFGRALNGL